MVKGVSIKFRSYAESVPTLLKLVKFDQEVKKHLSIVLKPSLKNVQAAHTPAALVEEVLKFIVQHKGAAAKVFIAEGSDGDDTFELFEQARYKQLAETYNVGLIDLNTAETEEMHSAEFMKFDSIHYPKLLRESFVITLPRLAEDEETELQTSLATMLGAFPAERYSGFFSTKKTKIRNWPVKYSIHDIVRCKMPDATLIDASDYGVLLLGRPLAMDQQAARLLGRDPRAVQHLKLISESLEQSEATAAARAAVKAERQASASQPSLAA